MGNKEKTTGNLMAMLKRYNDSDKFPWGNQGKVTAEGAKWTHDSKVVSETAGGSDPGRSGTYQLLLLSEVAYWAGDGVRSADIILDGILKCVPFLADTLIIMESTPNGAAGAFYERYQDGMPFDDFMSGKKTDGYVRIFSPWFEFADSEDKLSDEAKERVMGSLTREEEDLIEQYKLTAGNISFRRRSIAEDCQGDPKKFDQDFPSNEEDCWLASGRLRFDGSGIRRIEQMVKSHASQVGMLDSSRGGGVIFRPTDRNEGVFQMWEQPRDGLRYIMPIDTMTGEQSSGKDPDAHAALILRAGYIQDGVQKNPAVVARITPPCRYDIDMLAEMCVRLSLFYGGCLMVPEMNGPGLALIQDLKKYDGVNLYRREVMDLLTSQVTEKVGWQTADGANRLGNRSMIIETLATAIRDGAIDIYCPHILQQLKQFIVNARGKSEALSGKHDDDCLSLAIGLFCISGATAKSAPVVQRGLPPDLRDRYGRGYGSGGSRQFT